MKELFKHIFICLLLNYPVEEYDDFESDILDRNINANTDFPEYNIPIPYYYDYSYNDDIISIPETYILSSSYDYTVKMWNTLNGTLYHTFYGHKSPINCIDILESYFITGSSDGQILYWNVNNSDPIGTFVGNTDQVNKVRFSLDRKYVISASRDGLIIIWSIKSYKILKYLRYHIGSVISLNVSKNYIISGSTNGFAIIWSFEEQNVVARIQTSENEHTLTHVYISYCETYVLIGGSQGNIILADLKSKTIIRKYHDQEASIIYAKITNERIPICPKKIIISASSDGLILVRDFYTNEIMYRYNIPYTLKSVKMSKCGRYYLIGTLEKKVVLFNSLLLKIYVYENHEGAISGVVAHSNKN